MKTVVTTGRIRHVLACVAMLAIAHTEIAGAAQLCLRGVNVAGAEFGDLPGRYGFDYAYPTGETIKSLGHLGLSAIRLPVRWERLQPRLNKPLDSTELARLDATIALARSAGLQTIVDLHNYAYFNKARIGSAAVPASALADVWKRLASHLRRERSIVFGLMNEPYDISALEWLDAANAAIVGIRSTGAQQLILVPGTAYSGAHSWTSDLPVGNNGRTLLGIRDPMNNYAYELHQYLDGDYSGRASSCENGGAALAAIQNVGAWLATNKKRGFLGEIGASKQPECLAALSNILQYINNDRVHWIGWTAWAAGERWPADYPFNLQPSLTGSPALEMLGPLAKWTGQSSCGGVTL
jgi:endoglucanase